MTFKPFKKTLVGGVRGIKTHAAGRGTITLKSTFNKRNFTLTLKDVLYIPRNKNNLISLERWEATGGKFAAHKGVLMLTTESGHPVVQGP